MMKSAKITVSTLHKIRRRIPKGSTFHQYYEAKLSLDAKDHKDLKDFRSLLARHIKNTRSMMRKFKKPFTKKIKNAKKTAKIVKKLENRFTKV